MKKLEEEAKTKKIGVWSDKPQQIEKHTRALTYFSETGYNAEKLVDEAKKINMPLEGIVEHVFNAASLSIYVSKF